MTIYVEIDSEAGQRSGDWVVKNGRRTVSRHRTKSTAMSKARQEARQRNAVLKEQTTNGQWRTVVSHR